MAILKRTLHFADYEMATMAINAIKTDFKVVLNQEKSPENGLLLTYELDSKDFNDFIEIMEGFSLQVY